MATAHVAKRRRVHALITGRPGVGKTTLVRKIAAALEERGVNLQGFYTEEVRQQEGGREGRGRGGVGRGRGGPRIGFDVVSLDGQRGILARVERPQSGGRFPTVGRYFVHVASFEQTALSTLQLVKTSSSSLPSPPTSEAHAGQSSQMRRSQVVEGQDKPSPATGRPKTLVLVIDEIGKMELFSRKFTESVRASFEHPNVVVVATIPVASQKPPQLVEELRCREDCQLFQVSEQNRDGLLEDIMDFLSVNLK